MHFQMIGGTQKDVRKKRRPDNTETEGELRISMIKGKRAASSAPRRRQTVVAKSPTCTGLSYEKIRGKEKTKSDSTQKGKVGVKTLNVDRPRGLGNG